MLRRFWQRLKRFFQRIFGIKRTRTTPPTGERRRVEAAKPLTDAEYEALFLQLLAEVNEGCSKGSVKGFLAANRIKEADLVEWLRGFGERLLASPAGNEELGRRLVLLGELSVGEVGDVGYEIGVRLLGRGETNRRGAEDAEEEGEREEGSKLFAEVWFNQGNEQFRAGDLLGAIASYDKALEIKPDDHDAWFNRGVALRHLGQDENAIASYDKALEIKPNYHEAWFNRGNALIDLGQDENAIASFDKALEIKPDDHKAWYNRGNALVHLGQDENAIAFYDKALEIKPDKHEAWFNRGNALDNLGQDENAIASFDKALEIKPDDHEAWYNRGVALGNLGQDENAIASFDKALEIKPDKHEAWFNRGNALDNLGQDENAIASFDKALEIKPDDHKAWYNRGVALGDLGQDENAIAFYDKALEIKPDKHEAWFNRGNALDNLGQYENAIASFDKALEIKPDDHEAWFNRGNALGNLGQYEKAIASYDKALKFKPDKHEAWHNRGVALVNLGQYEKAIASYDKALKFKPDDDGAWNNRGSALGNLGQDENAIASFDKALEIKPDYHEAWYNRGVALGDLGQDENAIASYDKALEIKPDYHEAWINRGIAAGSSVSYNPLPSLQLAIVQSNTALNQRGYEGKLASYQQGLTHCHKDTHPEGWGKLHQAIGNAHYFQGRTSSHRRAYWHKAIKSYNEALNTLEKTDFHELYLEVLQNLIRVCWDLGEIAKAEELQRRGTDLLRRLLDECKTPKKKKQLALKFAGFQQFTVDLAVQSGNWCAALELAEQGKNACLSWLLDGWSDASPTTEEMQQLLNPTTAIIYWHLSPYALHTFILKHNTQPIVLKTLPLKSGVGGNIHDFENWVKEWNQQYADYRKGKESRTEKAKNWRDNLPAMLQQLSKIIDISAVVNAMKDLTPQPPSLQGNGEFYSPPLAGEGLGERSIQNIILIPHRDLHRFPLHALFPDEFTIIYLPSAQVGLIPPNPLFKGGYEQQNLLSIEHPESVGYPPLEFAQVESAAITRMFPQHTRKGSEKATKAAVIEALPQNNVLHFTGHGEYNFHHPALSNLMLAGKDKLTVADICNLDLTNYQLVSLAACETAITGNHTITTEYVGLVSGFMGAGVRHVVSTLWTVESAASALVMMQFYQLLQQGKSEAVALAETTQWLRNVTDADLAKWYETEIAKLPEKEVIIRRFLSRHLDNIKNTPEVSNQPYNHPYFWAAFTITGNFTSCNH